MHTCILILYMYNITHVHIPEDIAKVEVIGDPLKLLTKLLLVVKCSMTISVVVTELELKVL